MKEQLPEFPPVIYFAPVIVTIGDGRLTVMMRHAAPGERAYVNAEVFEAAMARLRLAMESMRKIARGNRMILGDQQALSKHELVAATEVVAEIVEQALSAIGEIPE